MGLSLQKRKILSVRCLFHLISSSETPRRNVSVFLYWITSVFDKKLEEFEFLALQKSLCVCYVEIRN